MKKYLSVFLAALLLGTIIIFGGCDGKTNTDGETENPPIQTDGLKFGVGSFSSMTAADAEDESFLGEASLSTTVAAVLLDENGKIVACKLDSVENAVSFNVKGEAQVPAEAVSKYEKGTDYGMSSSPYAFDMNGDGIVLEWFEQADAFCSVAKGKTVEELKVFVAEGGSTSGELATAGCTVNSYDFIKAVEKAVESAIPTTASADDTISIGFASSTSTANATEVEKGSIGITFTFSAVTVNGDKKVTDIYIDVADCTVEIDRKGVATASGTKISTKKELGDNYNMAAYGTDLNGDGVVLEWYKQAEVFENACIGKTATEISAFAVNGYGTEEIQKAGCTIAVSDFALSTVNAIK